MSDLAASDKNLLRKSMWSEKQERKKLRFSREDEQNLPDMPAEESSEFPANVCDFCRQLNLQRFFDMDPRELYDRKNGFVLANAGSRYRGPGPYECRLCRLFAKSRVNMEQHFDSSQYSDEIRVFSFLSAFYGVESVRSVPEDRLWKCPDSIILVVMPPALIFDKKSGSIVSPGNSLRTFLQGEGEYLVCYDQSKKVKSAFTARLLEPVPDLITITEWLRFCQSHHQGKCKSTTSLASGLQVIDCSSSTVVPAPPSCSYVALSYVWGKSIPSFNQGQDLADNGMANTGALPMSLLPDTLPNVIKDAITFTQNLGFSYLWIDKYCISQADAGLKHKQIMQMDRIYQNAEVTLIAAAGDDENHGLPGVGNTPRAVPQGIQIGNLRFTSLPCDPVRQIKLSKWFTRGWTFQEGVLARRRLIFTKEQVYFECDAMNCSESLPPSLDLLHVFGNTRFKCCLKSGIFAGSFSQIFGAFAQPDVSDIQFDRFREYVRQYSERELGHDKDSLNAFLGIIRHFKSSRSPIWHLIGLPLVNIVKSTEELIRVLAWCHSEPPGDRSARLNSQVDSRRRPRRRVGFPSWSWVGWAAKASLPWFDVDAHPSNLANPIIELNNGEKVALQNFYSNSFSADSPSTYPRALHFDAHVLLPATFRVLRGKSLRPGTWIKLEKKLSAKFTYMWLSERPEDDNVLLRYLREGIWSCVVLSASARQLNKIILLVVKWKGGNAHRVGLIEFQPPQGRVITFTSGKRRICLV